MGVSNIFFFFVNLFVYVHFINIHLTPLTHFRPHLYTIETSFFFLIRTIETFVKARQAIKIMSHMELAYALPYFVHSLYMDFNILV